MYLAPVAPEGFYAVEAALFGEEDVSHEVEGVYNDPAARRVVVAPDGLYVEVFEGLFKLVGEGAEVRLGSGGRDNEVVCDGRFPANVENADVLGFFVVESLPTFLYNFESRVKVGNFFCRRLFRNSLFCRNLLCGGLLGNSLLRRYFFGGNFLYRSFLGNGLFRG